MNAEFMQALEVLQKEKNINKEELISAIEDSITAAYKKNYGSAQNIESRLDPKTGEISVYVEYRVVEEIMDGETEMPLEEAWEYDPELKAGDICRIMVTPKDFGRIAAQNAKQLIIQKIKEEERKVIFSALEQRQEQLITGIVSRIDRDNVYIDIGDHEATLLPSEQIKGEVLKVGQRVKVLMLSVRNSKIGPQAMVSRTHPLLVRRLFENEVPEIYNGHVMITAIAREAGSRSKIAVSAQVQGLDAVGACVGQKGVRVQQVINDLGGEKIDVVKYSDDIKVFITNALSPAKVFEIYPDPKNKMVLAVVDNHQFSLAIGKEGQNVRLAAKLTGWKIDIKNKVEFARLQEEEPEKLIPFGIIPEGMSLPESENEPEEPTSETEPDVDANKAQEIDETTLEMTDLPMDALKEESIGTSESDLDNTEDRFETIDEPSEETDLVEPTSEDSESDTVL